MIKPFKFWSQHVLPLVYDDSLSYYEVLSKVRSKLNEVIDSQNGITVDFQNLTNAFNELHDYVNNYFDNLNLTEEVRTILNEMKADGTLDEIINDILFNELWSVVNTLQADLTTLDNSTVKRNDVNYITLDKLTQEVREAMTGGSVAVVGVNSVNTTNIVDEAVNKNKLQVSQRTFFIMNKASRVDINTTAHTVTFTNMALVVGGRRIITNTVQSFTVESGITYYIYFLEDGTISVQTTSRTDAVYIGSVSERDIILTYGCPVYRDGVRYHSDYDTWVNFPYYLPRGLNGATQYLCFDIANDKIIFPQAFSLNYNNERYDYSNHEEMTMPENNFFFLVFNTVTNDFEIKTESILNANEYLPIAYVFKPVNYVNCMYPHTVCTKATAYYNTMPEIALFGDSIVAGYNGLGVENIVSAKSGIRLHNYGIGSTGYIVKVTSGTTHLAGNGNIGPGTQTVIDYEDNDIVSRIVNNVANMNEQIIAIMAGTNDIGGNHTVVGTINAMVTAIEAIYNASKLPVIISPIRRRGDFPRLDEFVEAQREKCKELGVKFIDMYNISLNPNYDANNSTFYYDGLHPNNRGFYVMSTQLIKELKTFISNETCFGVR